jgi:hypothetical protein
MDTVGGTRNLKPWSMVGGTSRVLLAEKFSEECLRSSVGCLGHFSEFIGILLPDISVEPVKDDDCTPHQRSHKTKITPESRNHL